MFVDKAKIKIKAGDGGDGAVSFHREKYVAAGGPDGGDGGRGGDIVFQVDDNFSTLIDFRYKRKYFADKGENGGARNCTGKSAPPLVIKVPRGTLVKDAQTGRIMADMSTDAGLLVMLFMALQLLAHYYSCTFSDNAFYRKLVCKRLHNRKSKSRAFFFRCSSK